MPAPSRASILAASGAIYLVWGSAYLAMKVGLATITPLLLAGARLLLAGILMSGYALARGHRMARAQWRPILIAAALLFLGGHAFLYWGQQRVSSGLGAVLFSTIPLWVVLVEGLSPAGIRLGWRAFSGLGLGTAGILLLVGPAHLWGAGRVSLAGAAAISFAALSWALGSIYCTRAALPRSGALAGGLEMLCGGVYLLAAAPL
ncbi:MAG: EamA family transporter, partial [Terriglobales bacterium]